MIGNIVIPAFNCVEERKETSLIKFKALYEVVMGQKGCSYEDYRLATREGGDLIKEERK